MTTDDSGWSDPVVAPRLLSGIGAADVEAAPWWPAIAAATPSAYRPSGLWQVSASTVAGPDAGGAPARGNRPNPTYAQAVPLPAGGAAIGSGGAAVGNPAGEAALSLGRAARDAISAQSDEPRVTIYRAVGPAELDTINSAGNYGHSPSFGGKYFAHTENGARTFARSTLNADIPMTITSTTIPQSLFAQGSHFPDPGEYGAGNSVHYSDQQLPTLYQQMTRPVIIGPP